MKYYTAKEIIRPWLYGIYDPMGVYVFLALGRDKALLYDTGYGIAPIEPAIREITGLPVVCVLGHGHIDHANGAYQFQEAWIHENDRELCLRHTGKTAKRRILDDLEKNGINLPDDFDRNAYITSGAGNLRTINAGQIFDLGGLAMEVVMMEGHTGGSVGLLAREQRILLTGDAANGHLWLFLEESTSVNTYVAMLERNINLEFDTFFTGHDHRPHSKEDFIRFIDVAKNVNMAEVLPYDMLSERNGFLYAKGGVAIVFSKDKLSR